ncbi:MAG TPA: UDP-glucose/GDP-mannose dehydrogenase family protein [Candidatus Krumholzibacteria bacterium]|nr:UDP-glucose/GDP-mannose dehydrogenase family protein [Candidatus Krumholzibacteria bacterium]
MRVSIIGAGYVGIVTGACLAEKGHSVVCVEVDAAKVERIRRGEPPIHEEGLAELLRRHSGTAFRATTSLAEAVAETDITLIAVGTPFDGRAIDLTYVTRAAREIGELLARKRERHTVVVKSTVVPGTTDGPVREALESASGKKAGEDFGLGANPEFLTEGTAVADFMSPDRIVIGGIDARTLDALSQLYAGFEGVPLIRTNNATAEMIKYASNSLLAAMISFSNEIADLCSAIGGIDAKDVMAGVHESAYLNTVSGHARARAPIASFLEAGCGFGGSCLPKDVSALVAHGGSKGVDMRVLRSVLEVNRGRPDRVIEGLKRRVPSLQGAAVAVLGLAFKPDTDDVRESPAFPIIDRLLAEGAAVTAYDPVATEPARRALAGKPVRYAQTLEGALREADVVVLVTRWREFVAVPELLRKLGRTPLVFDGRRMLDKNAISRYEGIGL